MCIFFSAIRLMNMSQSKETQILFCNPNLKPSINSQLIKLLILIKIPNQYYQQTAFIIDASEKQTESHLKINEFYSKKIYSKYTQRDRLLSLSEYVFPFVSSHLIIRVHAFDERWSRINVIVFSCRAYVTTDCIHSSSVCRMIRCLTWWDIIASKISSGISVQSCV